MPKDEMASCRACVSMKFAPSRHSDFADWQLFDLSQLDSISPATSHGIERTISLAAMRRVG
jgi:hypothetical protein